MGWVLLINKKHPPLTAESGAGARTRLQNSVSQRQTFVETELNLRKMFPLKLKRLGLVQAPAKACAENATATSFGDGDV